MKRGELYRVRGPTGDTKRQRVFVVVSRPAFVAAPFSTVICAPVYTVRRGIETEVHVGPDEGLKHASAIMCDGLHSLPRTALTDYIGTLSPAKLVELRAAIRIALAVE
ncbi:MAG: type II toxin-antitoxin system PemK/MazF family toxin [Acidobacteriota bacterium]